jgi:hypothetical protein
VEVYHGKWEQDLHRAPNHRGATLVGPPSPARPRP